MWEAASRTVGRCKSTTGRKIAYLCRFPRPQSQESLRRNRIIPLIATWAIAQSGINQGIEMKRKHGFTLLELLVTLAVASILLSVGVPSFRGVIMDNRMVRDSNQFVASVNLARSAAVRFQRNATITNPLQ